MLRAFLQDLLKNSQALKYWMSKTDGGADFFDQINEAEVSDFQEAQVLVSIR